MIFTLSCSVSKIENHHKNTDTCPKAVVVTTLYSAGLWLLTPRLLSLTLKNTWASTRKASQSTYAAAVKGVKHYSQRYTTYQPHIWVDLVKLQQKSTFLFVRMPRIKAREPIPKALLTDGVSFLCSSWEWSRLFHWALPCTNSDHILHSKPEESKQTKIKLEIHSRYKQDWWRYQVILHICVEKFLH